MKRTLLSIFALLAFSLGTTSAQTARVQIIHNSADPAAETVDVYIDTDLAIDNFAFRTATPFLDLPAGTQFTVGVAASTSQNSSEAIATFPLTLEDGATYTVIASGVLDPSGFSINPNHKDRSFTLLVKESRESANDGTSVDFFVGHGSTDAPAVNVIARDVATLSPFTVYGDLTDYFSVVAGSYTIDIQASVAGTPLASFTADLSGLSGGAAAVLASGFLSPADNQNGPAFAIIAVLPDGTVIELPSADLPDYSARAQIIHNAADPAAAVVDIYVDGALALDDFAFRTATPFIDLKAEEEIIVGIAPSSSSSAADAIASIPLQLADGGTYSIIANGVLDPASFSPNPDGRDTGFGLWIADAREFSHSNSEFQFAAVHGASDAPAVDVVAREVATLVSGAKYGDITPYIGVPAGEYVLDINAAGTSTTVASFVADLSGLNGASGVVLASGFLNPAANGNGEAFALIAVLADGTVVTLPAAQMEEMARIQIIHNAADPAAAVVDIYLEGELAVDDFAFRSATPFIDVPGNDSLTVSIAGPASSSVEDAIANFDVVFAAGGTYTVVANGVLDPGAFADNPEGNSTAFTLWAFESRESAQDASSVEIAIVHGATDAPAVDVVARDVATLAPDAQYGAITDYIPVPASPYIVDVKVAGTETVAASFEVDLTGLDGQAATVLASGFLAPADNQNGPGFGVIAVLADGTVVEFSAPSSTARVQIIHNSPDPGASVVDVYVGDALAVDDFSFGDATPYLDLPAGEEIVVGIAPASSSTSADAIATFPFNLPDNETFTVVASGVLDPAGFASNPDGRSTSFDLLVAQGKEQSSDAESVDVLIGHGSPDAPTVDVVARGVGPLVTGVSFGDFSDYLSVPAGEYTIDIKLAGTETIVSSYYADFSAIGGETASIIATGFLDPAANQSGQSFGLSMIMADGESSPVVIGTSVDDPFAVTDFKLNGNYPNPFAGKTSISLDIPSAATVDLKVYDLTGKMVKRLQDVAVNAGSNQTLELDMTGMPVGMYVFRMEADTSSGRLAESGKITVIQ